MNQSVVKALAISAIAVAMAACGSSSNNNSGAKNANPEASAPAIASGTAAPAAGTAAATAVAPLTSATAAGSASAVATASAAAQKVKTGGTLTLGTVADVINLDSAKSQDVYSSYVQAQVAEPLFIATQDLKIVGNLVDKVDNPDDKTYVFHIHPGIKFQDGTDLNADAVKWNLQRHIDDTASVRHPDVKPITGMESVDAQTLKISLKNAYAPFLTKLTNGAGYMYSPTTFQKLGDKISTDLTNAGSGPFKFVEWKRDDHLTLQRNPNYWRKDAGGVQYPYLDTLIFKPVPDENAREAGLKTGELDYIDLPPPKDLKALGANSDLTYKQVPGFGFDFVMLETEKAPFNDKLVRQALAYAIDRQQITDTAYFGSRVPGDVEIAPLLLGYSPGPYLKQNIQKAKDLLKQAGKPSVSFTLQFRANTPLSQQIAELIQAQVKDAGFDVTLQSFDFQTLIDNGNKGNYQAGIIGWTSGVDPDNATFNLFRSDAGFNLSHIKSPAIDALLDQGQQTLDPTKRADVYKQLSATLSDEEPFIILDWSTFQQTTRKNVQNFQIGP
ncbi:MAG: ABC transporter substrate-binding protein, partial [Dehalococcoidia bacterium]